MIKTFLIGNLTADARTNEINGNTVTNFQVGVRTNGRDANNEYVTNFVRVSAWGKLGQTCSRLTKGQKVAVTGDQTVRIYAKNDGTSGIDIDIRADSVEFLSPNQQKQNADDDMFGR